MTENTDQTIDGANSLGAKNADPQLSGVTLDAPGVSVALTSSGGLSSVDASAATVSEGPDAFGDAFGGTRMTPRLSDKVGRYYLLNLLAEGGMGAVYRAEQREPIRRIVALKLIRLGHESGPIIARFESERQALARMDHPNIAKVLDAGSDNGLPFFVMELVPGEPITEFADKHQLSIKARLELFIQVCDGMGHAHSKALLHRDIKAQNVLAYMADGKPMVKIIDFGIAKAVGEEKLTNAVLTSGFGSVLGTPYAMSPEQAEGSIDLDTRTDIYALGVLLYELLGGRLPFAIEELQRKTIREVLDLVRIKEPPMLSLWLAREPEKAEDIAKARDTKPAALIRELKNELECVPLKAMRKDRDRRYQSALQFSEDIQNYLQGRPVTAGPESKLYVARKFAGRNKLGLLVAASIMFLLISGGLIYTVRIEQERDRTERANKVEEGISAFAKQVFSKASPDQGLKGISVADALLSALKDTETSTFFDQEPGIDADIRLRVGAVLRDAGSYDAAIQQLQKALGECARITRPNDVRIAAIYSELAVTKEAAGSPDAAIKDNEKALEIYKEEEPAGSIRYAQTLNNQANCFLQKSLYADAVRLFTISLGMTESLGTSNSSDRSDWLDLRVKVLSGLGGIEYQQNHFDSALAYFERAIELRRTIAKPTGVDFADALVNVGNAQVALKQYDSGFSLLRQALIIFRDHGGESWAKALRCRASMATALRELHRPDEAVTYYRLCVNGMKGQNDLVKDLAAVQAGLGKTLLSMPGHAAEAEAPLLASFDYRLKNDKQALHKTEESLQALEKIFRDHNQPENAKRIHDRLAAAQ